MTAHNINYRWPAVEMVCSHSCGTVTYWSKDLIISNSIKGQKPVRLDPSKQSTIKLTPYVSGQNCLVIVDMERKLHVSEVDYSGPHCSYVWPTLLYDPLRGKDVSVDNSAQHPFDEVWTPTTWEDKMTEQAWLSVLLVTGQTERQIYDIFGKGWWDVYRKMPGLKGL